MSGEEAEDRGSGANTKRKTPYTTVPVTNDLRDKMRDIKNGIEGVDSWTTFFTLLIQNSRSDLSRTNTEPEHGSGEWIEHLAGHYQEGQ